MTKKGASTTKYEVDKRVRKTTTKQAEPEDAATKRQRLDRRTVQESVTESIKKEMSDMDRRLVYELEVDGKTMEQTMVAMKEASGNPKKFRFSKARCENLRNKWLAYDKALQEESEKHNGVAVVAVPAVQGNQVLKKLLIQAHHPVGASRKREPLYALIAVTKDFTKFDIACILESIGTLNVLTSDADRAHVMEVLKLLFKNGYHEGECKALFAEYTSTVDNATSETFSALPVKHQTPSKFYRQWKNLVRHVLSNEVCEKLFKEGVNLSDEADVISKSMMSSELAKRLFGHLQKINVIASFTKGIQDKIQALVAKQDLSFAMLQTFVSEWTATAAVATAEYHEGEVVEPRLIKVMFGTLMLEVTANDFYHEGFLRTWALYKSLASADEVTEVTVMSAILGGLPKRATIVWPEGFWDDVNMARDEFNDGVVEAGATRGHDVCKVQTRMSTSLTRKDRSWVLESAWFEIMRENGAMTMMQDRIRTKLPADSKKLQLGTVAQSVAELKKIALYKWLSDTEQGTFDTWYNAICKVQRGTLRQDEYNSAAGFKQEILASLIHTCNFSAEPKGKETADKEKEELWGPEALKALCKHVLDAGDQVQPEMLQRVTCYKQWLTDEERKAVKELANSNSVKFATGSVVKELDAVKTPKKAKTSASTPSASSGGKLIQSGDDLVTDLVNNFFGQARLKL